ncbi:50S ribosomal protein L10 [Candidatus Pinguicoccus supinus]|uniref:Large ribosomal subunit protein uL10 n=1 Tax=Candidatus Pinguicoccus supinus TaxID=2529394 RepID=A0A7T0BRK9_9BACT|nr:50S ribosomal protein L10 [Candidatus Pinguicoccus supinus]
MIFDYKYLSSKFFSKIRIILKKSLAKLYVIKNKCVRNLLKVSNFNLKLKGKNAIIFAYNETQLLYVFKYLNLFTSNNIVKFVYLNNKFISKNESLDLFKLKSTDAVRLNLLNSLQYLKSKFLNILKIPQLRMLKLLKSKK